MIDRIGSGSTAREGDGSALRRYRLSEAFSRTLFFTELVDGSGAHEYAVDVHYFADELDDDDRDSRSAPPVALYRDGMQILRSDPPSVLPVPGGVIEVATSMYGLRRMHVVPDHGPVFTLRPDPRTPEGLRARFARGFPRSSAAIGRVAIVVLIVGLILGALQALEGAAQLDIVAERIGDVLPSFRLPDWLNSVVGVATVVAAVERALTLRSHRLLDAGLDLEHDA